MFFGEYRHSLDSKNRIIIPAKLRQELGATFTLTKGLDGCLNIYTNDEWSQRLEKLLKLPQTKKEVRMYIRSLTSKATVCECDGQGRIQIPAFLKNEGSLQKNCVIVGAGDHVELWAEELWDSYLTTANDSLEDIAESLTEYM